MLGADPDAPRKQRHTVKRMFDRLIDKHGAVKVTYPMVRAYVADRRAQIRIETGRGPLKAFIPQTHMPGAEAEVGFEDVTNRLAGEQVKVYLFAMRLSYSGKAVHRIFASCGQEAFFEGHVHALSVLVGCPTGKVRGESAAAAWCPAIRTPSPGAAAAFPRGSRRPARWTFQDRDLPALSVWTVTPPSF